MIKPIKNEQHTPVLESADCAVSQVPGQTMDNLIDALLPSRTGVFLTVL